MMKKHIRIVIAVGVAVTVGASLYFAQRGGALGDVESEAPTPTIEKRKIDFASMVESKVLQIRSAGDAVLALLEAKDSYAHKGDLVVSYEGLMKFGSITNRCMVKVAAKIALEQDALIVGDARLEKFSPYDLTKEQSAEMMEMQSVIFDLVKKNLRFKPYPLGIVYSGIHKINNTFIEFER